MLNKDSLNKLIALNKNDRESLDFIKSCIDSFEQYHKAVFDDQMFQVIYSVGVLNGDEYRKLRSSVDRTRTINHNSVISNINILNRLASQAGIAPVYDGIVSEENPYRREVANAVFEYIENVINNGCFIQKSEVKLWRIKST